MHFRPEHSHNNRINPATYMYNTDYALMHQQCIFRQCTVQVTKNMFLGIDNDIIWEQRNTKNYDKVLPPVLIRHTKFFLGRCVWWNDLW